MRVVIFQWTEKVSRPVFEHKNLTYTANSLQTELFWTILMDTFPSINLLAMIYFLLSEKTQQNKQLLMGFLALIT